MRYTTKGLKENQYLEINYIHSPECYCLGFENNERKNSLDGFYLYNTLNLIHDAYIGQLIEEFGKDKVKVVQYYTNSPCLAYKVNMGMHGETLPKCITDYDYEYIVENGELFILIEKKD
jgi:hypothetical protein